MGRAKRKVFRPIFGKDLSSSAGRRSQEQVDNSFRAAQLQYEINAEKYRAAAIRNLGESLEGLNEAEKQILIDKAIADIMPKEENPFADISSNPNAEGAIQADEERFKAGSQVDYGLLDKAEVWMNASMNKLLANATQSIKAGSDVIRGASDYFFSGNDVSPNYMLSEAVEREGKGALYNIFGAGNKYLADTAESAERAIHGAEASLASRGMDSGFWHAASDMIGQWGFTYGGMGTAALGRLAGGTFSTLGKLAKSASTATRWAKASEYTRKLFSAGSHLYGALSEAAVESYGVSKALEEAKGSQLAQLRSMMQKDFDQDFYSYERKYGAIKFSDFADNILASSGMDPRLKREVANVLSGKSENASPNAIAAANAIVSQYKDQAEKAILQNASDEIDQRNGLASGWTAGLNTFILTFMNKYSYELATDKLAGANRLKKAGRFGALGSTLINATSEGIEEVVQGGISKGAESLGKRAVDEMLRASTISERNSTSIGVLGSLGEIGKGMWDTTLSGSAWTDEALPAIVSTLLMPMYKGSKFANDSHRTDAFGDARQKKKSWLNGIGSLYDSSPIGFSGVERYRDYKYSGGKQRTSDEAIEAMTKMVKGKHEELTNEEKKVMTEIFGQNYAEVVHETYQSVIDAMASADRMNTLLAKVAQSSLTSEDVTVAEELTKAHNVATMLSVIGNSSIGQANFNKRNFGQWTSDLMRSTREFGADMGHAISSLLGANNEAKEARYQAAVAKREADKAAREEARRAESDPFSEVPDNLRPFLNFLDVKETDEATLVSIARQRIENTLDPEEKKKMQEAYFQGEGSDKLTEKAIKDIAGEINKQKHTLADIATDYTKTHTFLDLTTRAGDFSGREKSRIAAAAASFNHLRRLASEYADAFEAEVSGLHDEVRKAAENRMSELLEIRETIRDNIDKIDDEEKKSLLEQNIKAVNEEIKALEWEMRGVERSTEHMNQAKERLDFSNALGGWEDFMYRVDFLGHLNYESIQVAERIGDNDLVRRLEELTQDDEKMSENGKLAIKFAREAMAGIESLNNLLEDRKKRESLVAKATVKEAEQAKKEGEEMVEGGESTHAVDEAADKNRGNGVTDDVTGAMKKGAEEAATKAGPLSLSGYKTAVHDTIKSVLTNNDYFMGILYSFGLDEAAAEKFVEDYIYLVTSVIGVGSNNGYSDYKYLMGKALENLVNDKGLAQTTFGFESDELINSVRQWIDSNMDLFNQDPTTPVQTLQGNPSKPDGDRPVDSIEFDQATQHDIESASIGGVTVLNYSMSQSLQELFHGKNALVNLLSKGSATINTSITFADGKATINVSISAGSETYEFSFSLSYDDLRNRLQMGVSLSTLIGDIVDKMVKVNEKSIRKAFEAAGKDYVKKKKEAERNAVGNPSSSEKNNEGRPSDTKPVVHEGPVPGSTDSTTPATDPTDDEGKPSLPQTGRLTLWDQYNPGLNEANLTSLSEEWQEKIRKWYEEKNVGLNLKNAKGKEIFYGFAEELSENGDVSNSPIVVYVKDEQDQFVPIGLLPDRTTGNTQVLINNLRAVATEDKKFNIFSSSDLNAPKVTISKVKYSPFEAKPVRGEKAIDAETIDNAVEEELNRGQVAISVTVFPNRDNPPTIKSTTHNKALADEAAKEIDAFIKEKESFLAKNYGQTYLVVLVNGKDGPKPILVGIKGRDLIVDLVQGTAEDSEASELADEYMAKLTEEFEEAMETPDGEASGVYGEKYSSVFGSSFVYSVKPLRDTDGNVTQVEITFPKRLNEGNVQSSAPVVVDIDLSSGNTRQALANAIVDAMKSSGKDKRRTAIAESIMGNKDEVEDIMTIGMRMTEVRDEAGFEALPEEKGDEEGNKTTTEPAPSPQGPEGTKPTPKVSTAPASQIGETDEVFGSANGESLEKIKDNLARNLVDQGYETVVKSSTSPHIAATHRGSIYMFEIDPASGAHRKFEWSQMSESVKADAFALVNSALSSDFKNSTRGRLLEYGDELSGTTHVVTVRRSTKGDSTDGKTKSSASNSDMVIDLASMDKAIVLETIKTEATYRGLILELAAKGVTSSTPIYFSEHTINGKTYGGGHKVILQTKDAKGKEYKVEIDIDNELGAQMDKIASDVRRLSVKKVAEGFAMISDVKLKDINKNVITGEADIVFFRNDEGKTEVIVSDVKSTLIASEKSSPAKAIRDKRFNGEKLVDKYKRQVERYENHLKSIGASLAEPGNVIAVGFTPIDGTVVVEHLALNESSYTNTLESMDDDGDDFNREALLPFERGNVYKEAHDVAKLLPQGMLYQALRIYQGIAEVAPGVWGRYRNGIIEVASGASAGTIYHEAMHFIYEKLLTDADRGMLVSGLSEVTEEQIREIFGNQIPIAYARDVRELSAELFRLWMQTKGDKKARKALEEKITRLVPKKKGFWGRLQALWERIKAALWYTPTSSIVSVLTGIEGGNYSHVSVASRVNATNLSSQIEGAVESMLRYGLMSEEEFNSSYDPSSIMASRNLAQLVQRKLMDAAYEALSSLEEDKVETEHVGRVRRFEASFDDAVAVLRDATATSEKAKHAVEIIDELSLDGNTRTVQEMDALEERTDNLLGQILAGCR
jgi:hypothetical protein|nr:MAG TPA: hypothetical protein [Crassvirales sp.]